MQPREAGNRLVSVDGADAPSQALPAERPSPGPPNKQEFESGRLPRDARISFSSRFPETAPAPGPPAGPVGAGTGWAQRLHLETGPLLGNGLRVTPGPNAMSELISQLSLLGPPAPNPSSLPPANPREFPAERPLQRSRLPPPEAPTPGEVGRKMKHGAEIRTPGNFLFCVVTPAAGAGRSAWAGSAWDRAHAGGGGRPHRSLRHHPYARSPGSEIGSARLPGEGSRTPPSCRFHLLRFFPSTQ